MVTSIDYGRIETALAKPDGWIELALVALCFAAGWVAGRRVNLRSERATGVVRASLGGVNRLVFPLVTLALIVATTAAYGRWHAPFFLSLALPLVIALALIRLFVYALRGVFGTAGWIRASERAISFTIWGIVVLYYLGVFPELKAELDAMQIPVGRGQVSVLEILKGLAVVLITIAATLWITGLVEQRLARAATLDANLRVVLAKFLKALLLTGAILIALQAVGIDLTLLSVFGGALGVGIGLGLQKLASNYIAGFTILLDRSVRMGDMITVDGRHGVVTSVTARYVVVKSLDGIEAIVPNETLVTTTVLNHSYTSKRARLAIPVQVSYDSDLDLALRLMVDAAAAHPRVLEAPDPPAAYVAKFGDSGFELELGVWIDDPEAGQLGLRSELNRAIWRAFGERGIRIPYPLRELRILGSQAAPAAPGNDDPTAPPAEPARVS